MFNTSEVTNEYILMNEFLSSSLIDDGALYTADSGNNDNNNNNNNDSKTSRGWSWPKESQNKKKPMYRCKQFIRRRPPGLEREKRTLANPLSTPINAYGTPDTPGFVDDLWSFARRRGGGIYSCNLSESGLQQQ